MRKMIPRIMPCLLLHDRGLVKTVKFKDARYIGDPRNAVRIFNEKEVDELILLDIGATPERKQIQFDLIREIVSEAFMPVAYGGGIHTVEDAKQILALGVEKIVLNSYAVENPDFITKAADSFGSSSVVVCIDVKKSLWGKYEVWTHGGRQRTKLDPVQHAMTMANKGAGEIVVNSIDLDGTMAGYDLRLISAVSRAVQIPVIASGGAGKVEHLAEAIKLGEASAATAGSMFVFQGKHRAVLISFPDLSTRKALFE